MADKKFGNRGATQRTPSYAQYFSWINNTNEGSTEAHTLINLEYFKWLKDEYGMQLDIYAWDAGNLDGAGRTYQFLDGEKIKEQYPNGYAPIAKAAADMGTRLGVWCGPDGFGDTEESAKKRFDQMVSLCKEHNFALFKLDGVCGDLRPERRKTFVEMVKECRKYSPDLVILNHRLELGEGNNYVTTELWNGAETYTDVHSSNGCTAPHHRAYLFSRGLTDGLDRLMEDHGVCISSCIDFFEDELIYQAFGRSLIIAPEVYGNPWLMNDAEQGHMAHIYNLHRRLRDVLVDGIVLPKEKYGAYAVARGSDDVRVLNFGNATWAPVKVEISLNEEIGLCPCGKVRVISHHPYEKVVGDFEYGDKVTVEVLPFRAALYEICSVDKAPDMPTGCEYIVLHEDEQGRPDKIKVVKNGEFDNTFPVIQKLGTAEDCNIPHNAQMLYETAMFAADTDSLETRAVRRSGKTAIPQVQAARDAFFGQKTFMLRGCDQSYMFDGNKDTFYDGRATEPIYGHPRVNERCLRIDLGDVYDADTLEIEFFNTENEVHECGHQDAPVDFEYSADLESWTAEKLIETRVTNPNEVMECVKDVIHYTFTVDGRREVSEYKIGGKVRYIRMYRPVNRIYRVSVIKDGKPVDVKAPWGSDLMKHYAKSPVVAAKKLTATVTEDMWAEGSYISVALEGVHGNEAAFAVCTVDGKAYGAPDRAPSYPSNSFEVKPVRKDRFYTYYIPVTRDMLGKELTVWVLLCDEAKTDFAVDCYICPPNREPDGVIVER